MLGTLDPAGPVGADLAGGNPETAAAMSAATKNRILTRRCMADLPADPWQRTSVRREKPLVRAGVVAVDVGFPLDEAQPAVEAVGRLPGRAGREVDGSRPRGHGSPHRLLSQSLADPLAPLGL